MHLSTRKAWGMTLGLTNPFGQRVHAGMVVEPWMLDVKKAVWHAQRDIRRLLRLPAGQKEGDMWE